MRIQGVFLLLLAGCGGVAGELDGKSEGDEVRDQSLALFLDRTMTDSLDGVDGDNTDWKYLDLVEKGGLRIDVGVDAPEDLKGAEVELFDEFGKRLDRRLVMPNQTSYSFEIEVEKIPNKYFVRTFTREGRSSYSVGARLAPDPGEAPPIKVVSARTEAPEPPEEETPVSCPAGQTLKGRRCVCPAPLVKQGSKCVEKKVVPPPVVAESPRTEAPPPVIAEAPRTAAPPVQTAGKVTVTGSVVRVVPSEDGRSATISIRLDADFNMTKGGQGTLYKNGNEEARFTVTRARGRQALATVGMSTGDLTTGGGKLTVKIVGE